MTPARPLVAAAAVLMVLSGCSSGEGDEGAGSTPTTAKAVDTREVESLLVTTQKRASPEFDVRDAACPARVVVTEGATFQCTVVVEGVVAPYEIRLVDVDGGNKTGRYDIRPAKAILSIPKLVDALQRNTPGARIDCGPERVKVLDVGATFGCQVTTPQGQQQPVTLRVDDVAGNVSQTTG